MVVAVGATGCDGNASGTGAAGPAPVAPRTEGAGQAPVAPRPAGTGPLTKAAVQADIDTSVADAGSPPADPDWAGMADRGPGKGCMVTYKGYGTEDAPVGVPQYEALVRELKERGWEQYGERMERRAEDPAQTVIDVQTVLDQRGWRVTTEYRAGNDHGDVKAMAYDVACAKKTGFIKNPMG
ncbi:hypothetical protein ADK34_26350 [Streptomyces viridochromogenes]|uniref:Lipoprotein n=2 Tax=Streptomyces TaxID=1883 RepID=A0A0L8JRG9_STRVR|nr:hypothetical protein ADK34_26350 [Streptomyces viridochromogenes]